MILVTGATGIVGSHFVLRMLQLKRPVRILVRTSSITRVLEDILRDGGFSLADVEQAEGDVNDPESLFRAMEGCDECYHCAAIVSFKNASLYQMIDVNTRGTENVVNCALNLGVKLCYLSTTAALGEVLVNGKRSEESTWVSDKGKSAYSISKRYAELEVHRGIQEGLSAVIVNPGIIIGPGNWGKSSTALALTGFGGINVYPEGINGFVDVRDVTEIAVQMMENPDRYKGQHVMVSENISLKEMLTLLAQAVDKKGPTMRMPSVLVKRSARFLNVLETLGLSPFKATSQSLISALSQQHFSSEKLKGLGFNFRPIKDACAYTAKIYRLRSA